MITGWKGRCLYLVPLLLACEHRHPLALPASPPRAVQGVWGHEAIESCSPRESNGDWAPTAACLASVDARTRHDVAASGRTALDGQAVERIYLPYTQGGRRYVLAIVYPAEAPVVEAAEFDRIIRGSSLVPYACGATDGGGPLFEETYVVGAPEREGADTKPLASCAGESGTTWEAACAGYEPPEDSTILYADPCDWYYRELPPDAVDAPGRYDRAALAQARPLGRAPGTAHDRLSILTKLSDICERRCSRVVRAELWDLRGAVARELGWQDGAQRALAEAASLREAK